MMTARVVRAAEGNQHTLTSRLTWSCKRAVGKMNSFIVRINVSFRDSGHSIVVVVVQRLEVIDVRGALADGQLK